MKKMRLGIVFLSLVVLCSCGKTVKSEISSNSSQSESSGSDVLPTNLPEEITAKFKGDWNMPGLFEKNGVAHKMPQIQQETGMEIDVTDYGAKANDATFDNYTAFKNAIANASEGDTVVIPEGEFYFKNYGRASTEYYTHIALKSGLTLRGAGKERTKIISNYKEDMNRDESTSVIAAVNQKSVVIRDLTVSSNTSDSVLPDPDNSNLQTTIYTAPKYGIVLASGGAISAAEDQARNLVIDNCLVEKFQRMGVRIAKVLETVVKNSTFQKATCLGGGGMGYGVNIQGYGNGFDVTDTFIDTKFNIIEDNTFVGPYLRHGALVQYYAHNNVIRNNKFTDLLLDSIDMHGEDEYSNEICNNVITNTRKGAAVGLGNTGATHDAAGRNNYVHDNVITGGARAIDILLGTPDTVVYSNQISSVGKGITCSNANGTIIMKNEMKNVSNDAISVTYSYNHLEPALGIPNDYLIKANKMDTCGRGIYLDSKGTDFVISDNSFENINTDKQVVDESSSFVLPEVSDLTKPVEGEYVLPIENHFITMESQNRPAVYQKNMKLKTTNSEPLFNRVIYALFDKAMMPKDYQKVYLSITAKVQTGTPTINIFSNQTYVDWTTDSICWDNSKLHHKTLGLIENTSSDPVTPFVDFTFPVQNYEFVTFYIDVTDGYNALELSKFTLVLTNENIDESYMEVYSNQQTANNCAQAFRLIFA